MVTACDGVHNYIWEGKVNPYSREVFWAVDDLDEMQDLFDKANTLIFHNTKFDVRGLEHIGIEISNFWSKIEDTLIASHCICSGESHNLKDLALKYLDYPVSDEKDLETAVKQERIIAKNLGWATAKGDHPHFPGGAGTFYKADYWLAMDECRKYACGDVERTWLLWDAFNRELIAAGLKKVYQRRIKLLRITYEMENRGMHFDYNRAVEEVDKTEAALRTIKHSLAQDTKYYHPLNLDAPADLRHLLFTHLQLPCSSYTETGKQSTDKETIKQLIKEHVDDELLLDSGYYDLVAVPNNPIQKALTYLHNYNKLNTRKKYTKGYINWAVKHPQGYFIHSLLNITGTRNTRQSSNSPNQQNLDIYQKQFFGPPRGYVWIDADLVNIELKIWATLTKEPALIEAFEQGKSVHLMIAEALYPDLFLDPFVNFAEEYPVLYRKVKGGNFAAIYGATERKIDATYGVKGGWAKVTAMFPGIGKFTEDCVQEVTRNMEIWNQACVKTLGGYRLTVPPDEAFKAVNYKVQGTAGEIMAEIMIALDKYLCRIPDASMVFQVHDSIGIELPIENDTDKTIDTCLAVIEEAGSHIVPYSVTHKVIYPKK